MNIFITGGTTGIGKELARLYLQDGHRVGVLGRSLENFQASGLRADFFQGDVAYKQSVQTALDSFHQKHRAIDLVIANAGVSVGKKSINPNFEQAEEVIRINLLGTLHTFHAAFALMKDQGYGHLVGVGSIASFMGLPGAGAYCASKAGVLGLCESFRLDFQHFGIDVTTVAPGFIDTPLTQKNSHAMPFMMSAEKGAKKIKRAIEEKRKLYVFPLPMRLFAWWAKMIPRRFYDKMMNYKRFNYSSKDEA